MQDYSTREVLEQAVQTEKLGQQFYSSMSRIFEKNGELKDLFEYLAGEEIAHEKTFTELRDSLEDEMIENWDEASLYMKAVAESEYFLGKEKALTNMDHIKTADEALKFAISFEKETLLYYYGLRDSMKDKELMNRIVKEEKSHIVRLSQIRKSLQ